MPEDLDDKRFAELFGFSILRPSEETLAKAREINALFDALEHERSVFSYELFLYLDMGEEHLRFLSNVAGCPQAVIKAGQEILAPGSEAYTKFLANKAKNDTS